MSHSDQWGDRFSDEERTLLAPFVTDLDSSIFGLRNLPEVVKGALFSRYSRTDKSLRRILLDEFIQAPESGFAALVGGAAQNNSSQLIATQQAEAFYERVLIGYGDDSVAELGGAHVALEGVSNIAAKALEDSRIGLSPLEKSTRYVAFNRKVEGRYRYHRPVELATSTHAAAYETAMDGLFDTYAALIEPTAAAVRARTPRDAQTSERAYLSATRAKALDLLRGLLPMATYTNVGLFGNGRAFEYLLTKLYAADQSELRELAVQLQSALDALIPSFVKRAKNERGVAYQAYLRGGRTRVQHVAEMHIEANASASHSSVTLASFDIDAEQRVVAAILYTHSDAALEQIRTSADQMSAEQRADVLRAYVGERANRFQRPGRALEEARYSFDILADLGAYRDLQRHRMLSQERQRYTFAHGYITPAELIEAGLAGVYQQAIERATAVYAVMLPNFPDAAQYAVPLACRVRWRMTMNLRELYHFAELRSAPQGHPTYRVIAQEMYKLVAAIHPSLSEGMRYVDMNDYALERLDAERRLDTRLGVSRSAT